MEEWPTGSFCVMKCMGENVNGGREEGREGGKEEREGGKRSEGGKEEREGGKRSEKKGGSK